MLPCQELQLAHWNNRGEVLPWFKKSTLDRWDCCMIFGNHKVTPRAVCDVT